MVSLVPPTGTGPLPCFYLGQAGWDCVGIDLGNEKNGFAETGSQDLSNDALWRRISTDVSDHCFDCVFILLNLTGTVLILEQDNRC